MTDTVSNPTIDDIGIGSRPVTDDLRRMRGLDVAVLWGNLSIGILVIAAGALLVSPADGGGLGLRAGPALLAIIVGSIAGAFLLAAVAAAAHDDGLPSMATLRGVIGRRGSYAASIINVVQLIGWTAFEFWAMAEFANRVGDQVFGFSARSLWLVVVAVSCLALAMLGPLRVVRIVLEKIATWVLVATCIYLTVYLIATGNLGPVWGSTPGSAGFAVAVDLVVAMPVSWLSVIADYNRFARTRKQSLVGTWTGYGIGNAWLYGLGGLLVLSGRVTDSSPAGLAVAVLGLTSSSIVGVLILAGLLTGETPNAFADIYSAAVSTTNIVSRMSVRVTATVVCAIAVVLAALVHVGDFESFLFLLGSCFVPLFAVAIADFLTNKRRLATSVSALRPGMVTCWLVGVVVYQWIIPTGPGWWTNWVIANVPQAGRHSWLGASLPSFVVSFVLAAIVNTASAGRPTTSATSSS